MAEVSTKIWEISRAGLETEICPEIFRSHSSQSLRKTRDFDDWCVPVFVRGGRCTPRIRPGGGEESEGDGGGRDRGSGGALGWWRPPRAGCSRRGEVTGGRDRCALLECARQSSSDAAMVTCVRGDGKGRAAARAHRGLSLDGEWGGRESEQPGPRTGNARRH